MRTASVRVSCHRHTRHGHAESLVVDGQGVEGSPLVAEALRFFDFPLRTAITA